MTDEEKEAIEIMEDITFMRGIRKDVEGEDEDYQALETLLNLIKKQQQKIEKLAKTCSKYKDTLEHYEDKVFNNDMIDLEKVTDLDEISVLGKKYISKDKIRELQDKYKNKIERLESKKIWNEPIDTVLTRRYINYFDAYEELLEELLEEE